LDVDVLITAIKKDAQTGGSGVFHNRDDDDDDDGFFPDMLRIFNLSCENAMSLSMPGVSAPCEKFPHSNQCN
jgi:hypothetical protein